MKKEPDPSRRREYADALTRVCKKPAAPWVYWGFRPPPRPAHNVAWERTEAIERALDRVLADADRAVRLAQKGVTARPESANYRNTLGVAHYRHGNDRAAIAELETAMRLEAGGTPYDWFFLAMAHWRLADREKARAFFDRSAEWMDKRKSHDEELCRIRAEAQAMLTEPAPR